jgi:hypothetical protein
MKRPLFAPFSSILQELQTRHGGFDAGIAGEGEVMGGMI